MIGQVSLVQKGKQRACPKEMDLLEEMREWCVCHESNAQLQGTL